MSDPASVAMGDEKSIATETPSGPERGDIPLVDVFEQAVRTESQPGD